MRYVLWGWGLLCLAVVVLFAIPIDNGADSVYGASTWFTFVVIPVAVICGVGFALISLIGRFLRRRAKRGEAERLGVE